MKTPILTLAIALALGTLAACDRNSNPTPRSTSATPSPAAPSTPAGTGSSAQSNTPSTPADLGKPSESEKAAQPPVQGREDVRQPEQRRDFEQKGDGAGPKQ